MGKLKKRDLVRLGIRGGRTIGMILSTLQQLPGYRTKQKKLDLLAEIQADPEGFAEHKDLGQLARELIRIREEQAEKEYAPAPKAADFEVFGAEHIEAATLNQMYTAMRLPVAVGGALMPDAHVGYGLPIGGVLATENSVIPYGVGVDIGCRMCMSVFSLSEKELEKQSENLLDILVRNTRFGPQEVFEKPLDDPIFERDTFRTIPIVRKNREKAYRQIGSSGGGNHFVEFGLLSLQDPQNEWGLPTGNYLSLLSHSGSRGLGAAIANYYTRKAKEVCQLPGNMAHLAWLDLDTELGQEYWEAMTLAGDYASACHDHIHRRVAKALGGQPLFRVENHHNFAWKEEWNGRRVIVHRKGATPAGAGVLGIIPGSMSDPGFLVRGRGAALALNSASHGAGRMLSRRAAKERLSRQEMKSYLREHRVTLVGGGLDEAPMAYKDIRQVMKHQRELVELVGKFTPKIVRMAN